LIQEKEGKTREEKKKVKEGKEKRGKDETRKKKIKIRT
jgi:hypothetical protein